MRRLRALSGIRVIADFGPGFRACSESLTLPVEALSRPAARGPALEREVHGAKVGPRALRSSAAAGVHNVTTLACLDTFDSHVEQG